MKSLRSRGSRSHFGRVTRDGRLRGDASTSTVLSVKNAWDEYDHTQGG